MALGKFATPIGGLIKFKNARHGIQDMASSTVINVTVSAVGVYTNCVVHCVGLGSNSADDMWVRGEMTSNTNLRLTRVGTATTTIVAYEVVEIEGAKSIQSGLDTVVTTFDVTITAVDITKSHLVYTWSTSHTLNSNSQGTATAYLFDTDTIRLTGLGASDKQIQWYVVESF